MNNTYCPVLFDTIYSSNENDSYNLCCFAGINYPLDKKYKQKTHAPFDFFLSDEMNEIRKKSLAGEKIAQCSRCYKEEKETGYSNRNRYIYERRFEKLPVKVEKVRFKLRHFGNHCNLGCLMCHPYNSTTRTEELKEIVDKLQNYYIPCKAKTYLEEITIPRSIVILRQFLKCHGYTLFSKEKFIKSKKYTIYKIVTIDKEVSTSQKKEKVVVSFD